MTPPFVLRGPGLWGDNILKQKDCNVMIPPVLMRCPLLKPITETVGLYKFFQNVVQELQSLPLSVTLECAAFMQKSLFVQKTL